MTSTFFKDIAELMNPLSPAKSIRQLWKEHRHITGEPISLLTIYNRHKDRNTKLARFLCYNTWFLRAPFNDKPVIPYRAYLLGKELSKSDYDIAALTEVFKEDDAKIVEQQSGMANGVAGDQGNLIEGGGGLFTLSQLDIVGNPNRLEFINTGGDKIVDSWAQKGVLHLEINMGVGNIDLYSTHLIFGTWTLGPAMPIVFGAQVSEKTRDRLRILQVIELRKFISETHKPENIAIVTGDFNIDAERAPLEIDPYAKIKELLANIPLDNNAQKTDFYDLWNTKGGEFGGTDNSFEKCKKRYTDGFVFCDDSPNNTSIKKGRIDYVFIEKPNKSHSFNLDTTILRRRPFPLPHLNRSEVIDMLTAVGLTSDLKDAIEEHFDADLDLMFKFSPTRRHVIEWAAKQGDLAQLVNNFLIGEIRKIADRTLDEAKHLSDHIGLDTIFIASPK